MRRRGVGPQLAWARSAAPKAAAEAARARAPRTGAPVATASPRVAVYDSSGFRLAVPPRTYAFPRDHASHPEFRTEWWYYTGHLRAAGRSWGYELTFFRVGLSRTRGPSPSAWATRDVLFAHLALTDETRGRFRHEEAVSRPALRMAGADTARYHVWIHDWSAALADDGATHVLRARTSDFGIALELAPGKPPAVHGEGGVSQKTAGVGNASHYYSMTRLATRGVLFDGADSVRVEGVSWMDHEFGSGRLTPAHAGWDWFSVQLDDGRELMLYRLRLKDGGTEPLSSGTIVETDGRTRHLAREDFRITATGRWKSADTGADYPSGWTLEIPAERLRLDVTPTVKAQELVARTMGGVVYWEGSCRVSGTWGGGKVAGVGYTELTGYTGATPF